MNKAQLRCAGFHLIMRDMPMTQRLPMSAHIAPIKQSKSSAPALPKAPSLPRTMALGQMEEGSHVERAMNALAA